MPCEDGKDLAPANSPPSRSAIPQSTLVKSWVLGFFKHFLTASGSILPSHVVRGIHAGSEYLRLGLWMRERGIEFPRRARNRQEVWQPVANRVADQEVLYLEFGVATGASMRYWSQALKHPDSILHGFDSFEGLPEQGGYWTKGQLVSQTWIF